MPTAVYEDNHYLVHQWKNSGMQFVNDMCEIYYLAGGKFSKAQINLVCCIYLFRGCIMTKRICFTYIFYKNTGI